MPSTMLIDSRRERSSDNGPPALAGVGTRQMRSIASCSSPNTVVAPNANSRKLSAPAIAPRPSSFALASNASIACAPSSPISPCNWPTISPCAASRPNTTPAIEITIMIKGAIENSV